MSRRTQDPACFLSHVVYGACTLFGRASNRVPLCSIRLWQSFNPVPRDGLGWSPFARRYSGNHSYFLLLRVLRCFSSPRTSHIPMDSEYDDRSSIGRVPPFGYRWIFAPYQLPVAFRSLARPSSVLSGQAFAVRPSLLDLGSLRVFFEILQNCSTTVYEIFFTKRYRPSVVFFVVRFSKIISEKSSDLSKLIRNPFRTSLCTLAFSLERR